MSGRSTNLSALEQQFGKPKVARCKASRSCTLSPREWMFFRFDGSTRAKAPQERAISASKASTFHSRGDQCTALSKFVRADTILTFSMIGSRDGRNFRQLSSIHPRSAFVTRTTVPACLASRSVSDAAAEASAKLSRCAWLTVELESSRKPCRWIQDEGRIVSSQSKMNSVSSIVNPAPSPSASPPGSLLRRCCSSTALSVAAGGV
mmetsp:Transcript_67965/g.196900  ORF Transcript_67965/g.196900 Transcript_67965/m.196900 type:complete len:206 (+) Transcript_67965:458-1075(+)